jgi:hypothetical protein
VSCSRCGGQVLADAGFCRNCGAILRGMSATASVISAEAGVSQPAGDQVPAAAALGSYSRHAQPFSPPTGGHPDTPAIATPAKWIAAPRQSDTYPASRDRRTRHHMLAFDYGIIAASVIVLFSATLTWYQTTLAVEGVRHTITRHLLSGNAGIQRPLVVIVAALTIVEVVLNMVNLHTRHRAWRAHRGVVVLLCVAEFVLVTSSMLSSPLSPDRLANIGISIDTGPGGWVALCGAVLGVIAAFGRMFAGRSALGRSNPV